MGLTHLGTAHQNLRHYGEAADAYRRAAEQFDKVARKHGDPDDLKHRDRYRKLHHRMHGKTQER